MNTTIQLLLSHRSIRRFRDDPVPDEIVAHAVRAGQMASTSSAVQAYCCLRIRDERLRTTLAQIAGPQDKVRTSPAFFLVCGDTRRHRLVCQHAGVHYDQAFEAFLIATIDASLFAQNMCVAFESMGYGICYIGGIRNDLERVIELLRLPTGVYPLFGLCVGRPAEQPAERPRLPMGTVLFEDQYPPDDALFRGLSEYDAAYREYLGQRGAAPIAWTESIAKKLGTPERSSVGPAMRSQGAVLE